MKKTGLSIIFFLFFIDLKVFSQITQSYSEVVFQRGELPFGMGSLGKLKIRLKGKTIVKLSQNDQQSVRLPSGKHIFSCFIIRNSRFELEAKPNTVHYLNVKYGGIFFDKAKFKLIKSIEIH